MKGATNYIQLTALWVFLWGESGAQGDLAVKLVSVAHIRHLPTMIPYEATAPLVSQAEWGAPITLSSPGGERCNARKECDALSEVEMTQAAAIERMKTIEAGQWLQGQRKKRALEFIAEGYEWCCGVATAAKVKDLYSKNEEVEASLRDLRDGLEETHKQLVSTIQGTNEVFADMKSALQNFSRMGAEQDERKRIVLLTNAKLVIKLIQNTVRDEIKSSCRNHLIPTQLVTGGNLQKDLEALQRKVFIDGYELAIGPKKASKYFRLEIADCMSSPKRVVISL